LNSKTVAKIGILVAITSFLILAQMSYLGLCFLGICDSNIGITTVDYPKLVPRSQSFPVSFTINNLGESTVENCILHFVPKPGCLVCDILSSPFSLISGEEIIIVLESPGLDFDKEVFEFEKERKLAAWVGCDNVESYRTEFKTTLDYESTQEQIEEFFTSENP